MFEYMYILWNDHHNQANQDIHHISFPFWGEEREHL